MTTLISIAILTLAYILTSLIGWVVSKPLNVNEDEKPISIMNWIIGFGFIASILTILALIVSINRTLQNFF
jgi:hypothetical protein